MGAQTKKPGLVPAFFLYATQARREVHALSIVL